MLTRISILAICLFSLVAQGAEAAEFPFGTQTFDEALVEAKKAKKPLLVKIYAVWCGPCKRMDKQVFADPKMMELADQFVAIKVDGDTEYGKTFNKKNQVSKYPTTLFFNAEGKEVYRLVGFRNLKGFMDLMDPFLKGTLRPEGSPPPLTTFQVAYRTSFHHAVNSPNELKTSMSRLDKVTESAKDDEKAMTEYLRGAWLERRVNQDPKAATKILKSNVKKHKDSTGASLSKLPLALSMAESGKGKAGLQMLMRDVSGTAQEKMKGAMRVAHFLTQQSGKPKIATLKKLEKAVDPSVPSAGALLSSLAQLFQKAGKSEKALQLAQQANALFPFHPWYAEQTTQLKAAMKP